MSITYDRFEELCNKYGKVKTPRQLRKSFDRIVSKSYTISTANLIFKTLSGKLSDTDTVLLTAYFQILSNYSREVVSNYLTQSSQNVDLSETLLQEIPFKDGANMISFSSITYEEYGKQIAEIIARKASNRVGLDASKISPSLLKAMAVNFATEAYKIHHPAIIDPNDANQIINYFNSITANLEQTIKAVSTETNRISNELSQTQTDYKSADADLEKKIQGLDTKIDIEVTTAKTELRQEIADVTTSQIAVEKKTQLLNFKLDELLNFVESL